MFSIQTLLNGVSRSFLKLLPIYLLNKMKPKCQGNCIRDCDDQILTI